MTVTIGALGSPWRGSVTPAGAIVPWGGGSPLEWWVAADDRWHVPAEEPSCRQRRLGGAPVVETLVAVPGGDAVHRAYVLADHGGLTVVEVENRSRLPFAVAFSHGDLLAPRRPTDVPVQGIELPAGAVVFPVAHRTTLRVALAHDGRSGPLPDHLASATQVVRGWTAQADRGGRVVLPDTSLVERVVAERCALLLEGPPHPADDPAGFLVAVGELCRLGDDPAAWVADVAAAAAALARRHRRGGAGWDAGRALDAAAGVLAAAGEAAGAADARAMAARLGEPVPAPADPPDGPRFLAWLLEQLVGATPDGADLLPRFRPGWAGAGLEVYRAPVPAGSVSFAVRWHGERPAVLWEAVPAMRLCCTALDPSWSVTAAQGEGLLAPYRPASFA